MNPNLPRTHNDTDHGYISPESEVNAGLFTLLGGASVFLGFRFWVKLSRRHGLWYDDYILIASWMVLVMNDILISYEYATGYVTEGSWDDRMHILINITSCGTLLGQALSKTAFAVTLLRMSNQWQQWILWFCIVTMNLYMTTKVFFQWAKVCGRKSYQQWYRLDFCIEDDFRTNFKEGGNIYNIIMDFVMALFPWMITWPLNMKRLEKVGLCVTMSLGMLVAIVSAARTDWKDDTNPHDEWYFWRNGISNVWYSSEVAGTIIVQCIPVLRPFLQEMRTTLTSRKLAETYTVEDGRRTPWRASHTPAGVNPNPKSVINVETEIDIKHEDANGIGIALTPLHNIPEEIAPPPDNNQRESSPSPPSPVTITGGGLGLSPSDFDRAVQAGQEPAARFKWQPR